MYRPTGNVLFLTHFAVAAEQHSDRRKTDEHVHHILERASGDIAQERMHEVPIEEPNESPVQRTDPHEYFSDLMDTACAFAHHT